MNKRLEADKFLVVEQKGWRVVIFGLSLAFIFSLTFKAVFSPRRIQYEVERVLSAADPRISTLAQGAHLSLSDGLWPRLAIVIDQLKLETSDPCLHQAKAKIENLEMPIAFLSLLNRNLIFNRIEVGLLNIEMKAKRVECSDSSTNEASSTPSVGLDAPSASSNTVLSNTVSAPFSNSTVATTSPTVVSPPQDNATVVASGLTKNKANLETVPVITTGKEKRSLESPPLVQTMSLESKLLQNIVFNKVHLKLLEWPFFLWNLKDIEVHLPAHDSETIRVDGMISLSSLSSEPSRFAFQGVNAKVEAVVEHNFVQAKIHGAWREGRIDVKGRWDTKSRDFNWNGNLKQIPWGQIIALAETFGISEALPISSQAWVSTKVNWDHSKGEPEHIELSETQIEGEFGDFLLGKVLAEQNLVDHSWKISPYKVLLKEINMDILTKILGWEHRYPAFEKFGVFEGEASYLENQSIDLNGELKNIKIVFSGKGRNQLQTVSSVKLAVKGKSSEWAGVLKDITLEGGQWNGPIEVGIDQNSKTLSFNTEFSQVKLNSDIEVMMTRNGHLSPLEGKLNIEFHDAKTSNVKGFLKVDEAKINEFSLTKLRVDFEGENTNLNGKIQIQDLVAPRSHLAYWPQPLPEDYDNLSIKNLTAYFNQNITGIAIKELQGSLVDLKSRFIFDAFADPKEHIQGRLQIRGDHRRKIQTYNLTGTRKAPAWTQ